MRGHWESGAESQVNVIATTPCTSPRAGCLTEGVMVAQTSTVSPCSMPDAEDLVRVLPPVEAFEAQAWAWEQSVDPGH